MNCLGMEPIIVGLKLVTQFTSMHRKSNKKTIAISTGLLAYTFVKLGDNLTNNDRDILIYVSNSM